MNIKQGIVLGLLFLAIFSAACVSASGNVTDEDIAEDINVTFDEQMWEENLTDINVDLPENASGEFSVKIDDEVIYNSTITDKSFKVPVKLPKRDFEFVITVYPPIDCRSYKVSAFYNNIELGTAKTLKVMKFSPDFTYLKHFPAEILQNDEYFSIRMSMLFPTSANGFVEIYLDNKLFNKSQVRGSYLDLEYSRFTKLPLGKHTMKVLYYNDTYYHPVNVTHTFEVVNAVIDVPQPVLINHDDCISVKVKTESKVEVYIDSKLISTANTEDGDFILSLEKYLSKDSREIKVVVSNKKFTRQKTVYLNVTYDLDIYSPTRFTYGAENVIELYLPDTLNNKLLTATIDGIKCSPVHPTNIVNNILEIDISKLPAGNHTLFVSYAGDARFEAKNKTFNFTVENRIICPYFIEFKDGSQVYLNLLENATGNLEVYIDDVLFKSVNIQNGHAEIKVDNLAPGTYRIKALYAGTDFNVDDVNTILHVSPKITLDCYFRIGEKKSVVMEVPKNCNGKMVISVNDRDYTVKIKNGKATFSLNKLTVGDYEVVVTYVAENGYETSDFFDVEVIPAKIKINAKNANVVLNHKTKYNVKLMGKNAKPLKNKLVKFKIAKKTYRVKTNSKGIATIKLPKLKLKTYKIKISYGKVKVTRKVYVKLLKLDSAKQSKSGFRLKATIHEAIKGKKVTFKFNGKKYVAKTDSKGVAKVTVKAKNLNALKTVKYQATYHKSTVKKSVRVQ